MKRKGLLIVLLCMGIMTACQGKQKDNSGFESLKNVVMAETVIEDGQYQGYSITLLMSKGQYYTEDQTAPGGGIYEENYTGEYVLQLKDAKGKKIDELSLNQDWNERHINFPGEFKLCVSDYNKDGYPDFTVGSYASSSENAFWLYSIESDRRIHNIGEFPEMSKDFSIFLNQEEGSSDIFVSTWNNASGEEEQWQYIWKETEDKYIRK